MSQNEVKFLIFPDGRMDTKNASIYSGFSEKTLAMKRCDGTGPAFIKLGRIFYFKEDLDKWITQKGKQLTTCMSKKVKI